MRSVRLHYHDVFFERFCEISHEGFFAEMLLVCMVICCRNDLMSDATMDFSLGEVLFVYSVKHFIRGSVRDCSLIRYPVIDRLVGLVVRRPPRERKIPGSNPACDGTFRGRVILVTLNWHSSGYHARRLAL